MIHFVVAQTAEARPLVVRYGLELDAVAVPFPIWRGDGVALVVAGCGKTAAAAATGFLFHAAGSHHEAVWINLGIAGHSELEIGRGLLAHKVVDEGSGATWFPPLIADPPCPTGTVLTVERLEQDYEGERLYDTEAAGFFAAASRFSLSELVHGFKVVADNHGATLGDGFSPDVVEDLVASKLTVLDALAGELRAAAEQVAARREAAAAKVRTAAR